MRQPAGLRIALLPCPAQAGQQRACAQSLPGCHPPDARRPLHNRSKLTCASAWAWRRSTRRRRSRPPRRLPAAAAAAARAARAAARAAAARAARRPGRAPMSAPAPSLCSSCWSRLGCLPVSCGWRCARVWPTCLRTRCASEDAPAGQPWVQAVHSWGGWLGPACNPPRPGSQLLLFTWRPRVPSRPRTPDGPAPRRRRWLRRSAAWRSTALCGTSTPPRRCCSSRRRRCGAPSLRVRAQGRAGRGRSGGAGCTSPAWSGRQRRPRWRAAAPAPQSPLPTPAVGRAPSPLPGCSPVGL